MAINTRHGPIIRGNNQISIVTGAYNSIVTDKATYTLKTEGGFCHQLVVGNVGTTWTLDFYDDQAGSNNKFFSWVTADGKGPFALQIPCNNGITVVSGGTTAGQASIVWS